MRNFYGWVLFPLVLLALCFFQACNRNFSSPTAPDYHPLESQSQYINQATGGTVTLPDGVSVQIPPNSFNQSTTVSITQSPSSAAPTLGPGLKLLKDIYYFNAGGASFTGSVTMTLPYSLLDIPGGYTESNLVVVYFNGASWLTAPSTKDTVLKKFTVVTNHFSPWGVGATVTGPTDTPTPAGPTFTSTPTDFPTVTPT